MAAKYLKSLVTGVVLPYNEPALKSADLRLMDPSECEEYERAMGVSITEVAPAPVVEPEPVFEEVTLTPFAAQAEPEVEVEDSKLMAALEVD